MRNCVKCGKELRENDAFCPACGASVDGLEMEDGEKKNWFAIIGFILSLLDCIPGLALTFSLFRKVTDGTMPLQEAIKGDTLMTLLIVAALLFFYLPGLIFSIVGLKKEQQSDIGGRVLSLIGICISSAFVVNSIFVIFTLVK